MATWLKEFPQAQLIFGEISKADFDQISMVYMEPGQALMEQSSFDDSSLYYILSGICEGRRLHSQSIHNGIYYVPIKIEKGNFIGFVEAIKKEPTKRILGIYAKTKVTALKIPRALLYKWAAQNTDILFNIMNRVLDMSWNQREISTTCSSHNTTVKLAFHLVYLFKIYWDSCYPKEYLGSVKIMETRQELAIVVGCSVRTIDRTIKQLRDMDLLSLQTGKIHITKKQFLALEKFLDNSSQK